MTTIVRLALASVCLAAAADLPARADPVAEFYKDKTVTMVISTGVGGGYDRNARLVARHLTRFIPGNPTIIPKNMPGAGNVLAMNFMYNVAPKDGSAIAAVAQPVFLLQPLGTKGVQFDARHFGYLGSSNVNNTTLYAWHTAGFSKIEEVFERELILGGTGAGSGTAVFPIMMNNLLGTKFKLVMGYNTAPDVDLAVARGEVQARAGNNFESVMSSNPDWIRDKKIVFLLQFGLERDPGWPDVPLLTEIAKTEEQREVFKFYSAVIAIGRPFFTTPNVPPERLRALQAAFDATHNDPKFLEESSKQKLGVRLTTGPQLHKIVEDLVNTPPHIVSIARSAAGEDGAGGGRAD